MLATARFRLEPALALAALLAAAPAARAQTIDFETAPPPSPPLFLFTPAPFSVTVDGLTATFEAATGAGFVGPVPAGLGGILDGRAFIHTSIAPYRILLDQTRTSVSFSFATLFAGRLTVVPLVDGTPLIGSAVLSPGNFGVLSLSGTAFNGLEVVSSLPTSIIDNVVFGGATVVPEPSAGALVGGGMLLLGVGAMSRRRGVT